MTKDTRTKANEILDARHCLAAAMGTLEAHKLRFSHPEKAEIAYNKVSKMYQALKIVDDFLGIAFAMQMRQENPDYKVYQAIAAYNLRSMLDGL